MAEPTNAPATGQTANDSPSDQNAVAQPIFNIEKIYIKDMSIEVPNAPGIFAETEVPTLETTVNIGVNGFQEGYFEVVVTATATTKLKDKVVFLVEVTQGGIFEVRNIPADQIDPLLGIHCPNVIFPYLRANVADVVTRAGFPALHLPNVNFEAFYAQRMEHLMKNELEAQSAVNAPASGKLQ